MTDNECPHCARLNEESVAVEGEHITPSDGDMSMCAHCGQWAIFDQAHHGGLRKPTEAEQRTLDADPIVVRANAMWRAEYGK